MLYSREGNLCIKQGFEEREANRLTFNRGRVAGQQETITVAQPMPQMRCRGCEKCPILSLFGYCSGP